MLRLAEGRGDPQADAQLFLHAPQQVFRGLRGCAGLPGERRRRCSSWRVQEEEDATVRAASRRSRSQTQAPGGQGWREGGEALMAPS